MDDIYPFSITFLNLYLVRKKKEYSLTNYKLQIMTTLSPRRPTSYRARNHREQRGLPLVCSSPQVLPVCKGGRISS